MSFDSDFGEIFDDFDFFNRKFMKRFQLDIERIMEEVKSGKIKGRWETREINEPGVKGYIIQGWFGSDRSLEPLEPMKPLNRRPAPEGPFRVPENALKEVREPLADVFEEADAVKVYVELPGEEKDDVKFTVTEGQIEIKARNFYKKLDLPQRYIDAEAASSNYKNGVLEVTIPKKSL